ncbi:MULTISPECIES: stage II sporulation protein M [Pseudoalteromonas]|uniref:stage II sporulation protein M n=1 Tax=Pseudoalteromonas TaxID=53246 RepID=UPI0015D52E44|nr:MULTISPECIES: stage II sporulation protein M [Pseudoalteromonas]QLJ09190.1 stage II sporulation protein M [Pseudoalteromonas sp. JSTW]QMW15418.1 stage II sporulation protein M [Pseudoalteromonas sp. MT33b]|tara:strand:+ start:648 stop:1598 length:951 start_codon:yes stop_codon:yes gene_type:complete
MKQTQFVKSNTQSWDEFKALCEMERSESLPIHFPNLYRKICNDLAIAQSRQYSPILVEQINRLVQLGQKRLYLSRSNQFSELWHVARTAFPRALYENRVMLAVNLLAFWSLALIAFIWVRLDPDAAYTFLGQGTLLNIEKMYDPSGSVQSAERGASQDLLMFGVYIYNNIGIAFQMFAGGVLFCVGAAFFLLFNSFYFGAIAAHIVNVGFEGPFFSFVITHGSFELTAIIIASAAGCRIGYALLNPGQFTRAYAIKQAAQKALPLIVGAFLMLVIAAFIEAFWSPRDIANEIKYTVGSGCWAYVLYRLYKGMRYGA